MRYFNLVFLVIFVSLSGFAIFGTIHLIHQPIILDYFYNSTLRMYEPVEITPNFGNLGILVFFAGFPSYVLFHSPSWFQLLYLPSVCWAIMTYVLYLRGYEVDIIPHFRGSSPSV